AAREPAGGVEGVAGRLLMGPGPHRGRTRAIERVREAVAAALPDGLVVRGPLPLRLGLDCVLVPDLVITAAPAEEPADEPVDEAGAGPAGPEPLAGPPAEESA